MSRLMIVEVPSYTSEFKGIREVQELVRCGECKHWRTKYFKDGHGWCEWHINETKADDFCSYGELNSSESPNNSERSSE